MSTSTPTVRVEIDFAGNSWKSETRTWTDVSEYVQAVNPAYGRDNEIGSVEAGTCDLTLDNTDGRFTPGVSASPYYPYVKPRRPMRIVATQDGLDSQIWEGVTGRFPATTATGVTEVTISCTDVTTPLSNIPLKNPYLFEVAKHSLVEVYPMNDDGLRFSGQIDPLNNYLIAESAETNGLTNSPPTVVHQGDSILPNTAGLGSAGVDGTSLVTPVGVPLGGQRETGIAFVSQPFDYAFDSTGDFAISMFYEFIKASNDSGLIMRVEDVDTQGKLLEVWYQDTPDVGVLLFDDNSGGAFVSTVADAAFKPGVGNHLVVNYSHDYKNDGSNIPGIGIFVNNAGGFDSIVGKALVGKTGKARIVIGSLLHLTSESSLMLGHDFRVEMVSLHSQTLRSADRSALELAASGMGDQTVTDRLNYYLDQLGWPTSKRAIDADPTEILFINWDGGTAPSTLDELRSPALDADGLLFIGPDGKVTYHSRHRRLNAPTAYTLDEDAGTGAEAPLEFDLSDDDIQNICDVDNAFGIKTTIRNEASIAEFGESSGSRSTRLADDEDAIQAAYWVVNRWGVERIRLDSLAFNPTAQGDGLLWDAALGVTLSDCVALTNLPDSAPSGTRFFVERVSHTIQRDGETLDWFVELQVSPADNYVGWILGDPTLSVLGVTTVIRY